MGREKKRLRLIGVIMVAVIGLVSSVVAVVAHPVSSQTLPTAWWVDARAIGRGARDFATGSCISCHALAGVSDSTAAIDLTHEGSRRSIPWLLHELAHPTSQRPPIPDGQLYDLAAYLASRR